MATLAEARAGMERALALARAGDHVAAQASALALAAAHPGDINLQHQAGVVLQLGGAFEAALQQFRQALELVPDFHFTEMEIASSYLAMHQPDEAVRWYLKAGRSAPTYALAFRRAGETLHGLGRHAEALQVLQQASACDPTDPEVAAVLADQLIYHDRRDAAVEVYGPVVAAGKMRHVDQSRYLMLLTELGQFDKVVAANARFTENARTGYGYEAAVLASHAALAARLDRPTLVAAAAARQATPQWLGTAAVVATLRAAIANRRPLSLIRMGDGEARFLAYCDPHLRGRLTPAQAELLGDVPFRNWFGQPVATADPNEVIRLQAATIGAMEQADILGVTSADRLATDNRHFGYLGHMEGLVASIARTRPGLRLTDAMVHLELHKLAPFYREILAGLDFLGVVSPHPGLAQRLARFHRIGQIAEYLLPGESRLPGDKQNRRDQPHFPTVYHDLYHRLAVPRPGAVFIVAGGLLAKIYCTWIRQRGGIAIDAGSIVDGWMGFNTRPGVYDRPNEWALPAGATAAG